MIIRVALHTEAHCNTVMLYLMKEFEFKVTPNPRLRAHGNLVYVHIKNTADYHGNTVALNC